MSRTAVIVSDAEDSRALCRLCMKYHEYYVNIFIPNNTFRICAEEAIHDLLSLKVAVGDGLPSNICHQCAKKLMEFRDFKEMCLKTAEELRKYDLDNFLKVSKIKDEGAVDGETSREGTSEENSLLNDIQATEVYITAPDELSIRNVSHAKEKLWSTENALVEKEEASGEEDRIEGDVPMYALASVAVDPLAVNTMSHAKEVLWSTENTLVVKEEVNGQEHHIEGDVPMNALTSATADPLAFHTMALKEEAQEPKVAAGVGNSLSDLSPHNHIRVTEVFVPFPDERAMGTVRYAEEDSRPTELIVKEEICEGLECSENDVPVVSLSSVNVDPLAVDTTVDRCVNIGGLTLEPEKESDKFGAGRQMISQKKVLNKPSCDPVPEKNLPQEHSMANSFFLNYFPEEMVKNQKKNLIFHASTNKYDQMNGKPRRVTNLEREELCHQAEIARYPRDYICNYCNTRCSEKTSLALHIKRHVNERRSAWVLPKKDFPQRFSQRLLVRDRGNVESVIQETSNISFSPNNCGGVKPFNCNQCGKMFSFSSQLNRHSVVHTGVKAFKCNECGKMFNRKSNLKLHLVVHTGVKPFKCNECGKMFSTRSDLNKHSVVHTGVKGFKCNVCGKMFTRNDDLKKHSVVHTRLKAFKCNECGKMFSTSGTLKSHSVVHTGVKAYKCNQCGKMFTFSSNLKMHSVVHSGVKGFKCNDCGKMFARKSNLKSHLVVHTGVKPFKCNECGKMFSTRSYLNKHSVVHTGVKGFKCNVCGKMFSRNDALKKHSVVHTRLKAFKCNECGKMFARRSQLRRHLVVHTSKKPSKCNECGKIFTSRGHLRRHSRIHSGANPL